jgi:ribose transport system permease protein
MAASRRRAVDAMQPLAALGQTRAAERRSSVGQALGATSQERSVLAVAAVLFAVFSVVFPSFLTAENLLAVARSVSALGILSIAMALVVIGRGIDLSLVATMGMAVTVTLHVLAQPGAGYLAAVAAGAAICAGMGLLNGLFVAFVEIPALFATFATGLLVVGFTRTFVVKSYVIEVPAGRSALLYLGQGRLLGIPLPILVFAALALLVHVLLTRTIVGWFLYAQGDNPAAARLTGIPVRPLTVAQYVLAAALAFVAGLVVVGTVGGFDSRIVQSALIFDVLTVVVVGGVSLAGGRGGVGSVLAGIALIGILLNGMTLLDLGVYAQNVAKGLILMAALILDRRLHPFDPETARQGE